MIQALKKESLRDKAAVELLKLIVSSRLPPGTVLSSVDLAKQMAISRTPVREALQRLEGDGFLTRDAAGVFRVPPLSGSDAREIYELRAELEPLALRLAGIPDDRVLDKLENANARIDAANGPAEFIRQDEAWHRLLLNHCPNGILIHYVEHLHALCRRYEYAYLSSLEHVTFSVDQHVEIINALRRGGLDNACKYLADNMLVGLPAVLEWLDHDS